MFQCITCNPDKRDFEATQLGLFYTALSRATTFGDNDGFGSAIYFIGDDYDEGRVRHLGKKLRSDEDYARAIKRSKWVSHLLSNLLPAMPVHKVDNVLTWASTHQCSQSDLQAVLDRFSQQKRSRSM